MTKANVYLTFDGSCREAFNLYQSVFGGKFNFIGTFAEMPEQEGAPPLSEEDKKRIMHVSLPLGEGSALMGSDTFPGMTLNRGNDCSVMIHANTKEKADHFFKGLSEGGEIEMPMQDTFWGSYFGSFRDRYGIRWMISFGQET